MNKYNCIRDCGYTNMELDRGAGFISITSLQAGTGDLRKGRLPKKSDASGAEDFWGVAEYAADCHISGVLSEDFEYISKEIFKS